MDIKIQVLNQKAKITNRHELYSGTVAIEGIQFEFSDEWADMTKTATVYVGSYDRDAAVNILIENDRVAPVQLPAELFEKNCELYVGVFGIDADGRRLTSSIVRQEIKKGAPVQNASDNVSIDVYTRIIQLMTEAKDIAADTDEKIKSNKIYVEQAAAQAEKSKQYAESAEDHLSDIETVAGNVSEMQKATEELKTAAEQSASDASTSEQNASQSEQNASKSATDASSSASNAKKSETAAAKSEQNARKVTEQLTEDVSQLNEEIVEYVIDISFKGEEEVSSERKKVDIKANEEIVIVNMSKTPINVLGYDEKNTRSILTNLNANATKTITPQQNVIKIGAYRYQKSDTNVKLLIIRYTAYGAYRLAKDSITADRLAKEFTNCGILRMELDTHISNKKARIIRPKLKAGMTFYIYSELVVNLLSYDANGENQKILVENIGRNSLIKITLEEDAEYLGLFSNEKDSICVVYVVGEYLGKKFSEIAENESKIAENESKIAENESKIAENESKIAEKISGNIFYNDENTITIKGKAVRPGKNSIFENKVDKSVYAFSKVFKAKKVKLSGRSYNVSTYHFYSYFFVDKEMNCISYGEQGDNVFFQDIEIDVPDGAYMIYLNGDVNNPFSLKLLSESLNFDQNFNDAYSRMTQKKSPKVITLGDSITMLGTSDRGWVKYFLEKTGGTLIANVAMNSAVLSDYKDTIYDGNPQQSNQTNNVLGNQIQKIINNNYDAPDMILIAIGTNGGIAISNTDIKNAYYDTENNLIDLNNVDRKTNAGAYRYATEKLHELYPNAVIFWCTPIMGYQKTRSADNAVKYAESLRIATEYTGQIMIDTIRCGINGVNEKKNELGEYLQDGLHPSIAGAKKIGYYNAAKVIPFIGTLIN